MQRGRNMVALFACLIIAGCVSSPSNGPNSGFKVRNDRGGQIIDYGLRTAKLRESGKPIRISGRCASACTLYLSLPANQICITPGTTFTFHLPISPSKPAQNVAGQYLLTNYPAWVRAWLAGRGGLTQDLLTMEYAYARQYMRTCTAKL